MGHIICETCGTQFDVRKAPDGCAVCLDERQYVGWQGQRWTTMEALGRDHQVRLEDDGGLLGIGISPAFAIDQRAILIPTDAGNILWETTSLVSQAAVKALAGRGGVDMIAISHPHFYASMVEWSEAFGGVPIWLHEADKAWVQRPSDQIRYWSGDTHALSNDLTLIRCGGHFPGSTALHWSRGPRGGGALFPGDALQVVSDRRHVTFMYSYPNYIPLHPDAVDAIEQRLAPFQFEDVFGFTWGRNIIGDGRKAVDRSFARYRQAIGRGR